MPSNLEFVFAVQLRSSRLPEFETEYRFAAPRRWRFDVAWVSIKLAVEIEGGVHSRGRHTRPIGYEKDCEKYNTALVQGWRVLRVTGKHIMSGEALSWVEEVINGSGRK